MDGPVAGLCGACVHARRVTSAKGAVFWRCDRSTTDARFPKYPPLPIRACVGFDGGAQADREVGAPRP